MRGLVALATRRHHRRAWHQGHRALLAAGRDEPQDDDHLSGIRPAVPYSIISTTDRLHVLHRLTSRSDYVERSIATSRPGARSILSYAPDPGGISSRSEVTTFPPRGSRSSRARPRRQPLESGVERPVLPSAPLVVLTDSCRRRPRDRGRGAAGPRRALWWAIDLRTGCPVGLPLDGGYARNLTTAMDKPSGAPSSGTEIVDGRLSPRRSIARIPRRRRRTVRVSLGRRRGCTASRHHALIIVPYTR